MKARVRWVEDMTFIGEAASGHAVVMDGPPELGGHNLGTRPMEMVLLGLGGCTAIDVLNILHKARQAVSDCVVEIDAERADSEPKVYTRIHVHFIVSGTDLSEQHVKRAVNLSAEKYCSVSIMLSKTAQMTHTYELRNE
ncbi:MAG: OsmC family protein [Candidatus Competibacteraceae bacterium]|jgi:putative redox protein|nr:OsmC family protein [Candidatus Competibacteraceae bacterium]